MSSSNHSTVRTFDEIWCKSELRVHEVNYVWTIDNFDFREAEGSFLYSSEFSVVLNDEIKWKLQLRPNGETDAKDTISFFLYICSSILTEKVYAKLKVSVLDFQNEKRCTKKTKVAGFGLDGVGSWGYKELLTKNDYFRENLLIDNKLTISCEIIFSTVCDATNETSQKGETSVLLPNTTVCDLSSQNFGLSLEHREFSDVIISVNGQEYLAHKIILAARSPVFAAMFAHNVKENEENRVYINDMDEEVASEMLRYIYTGKCEKLSELATGLLVAADKYDLAGLKNVCGLELSKTLSVDNAASILALADMHAAEALKKAAIKFIVSKRTEVLNTQGWKNIQSVALLNEVCSAALAHRK
ncbi:speckle-type POZ protein-like [Planococcus citri]|uniref:speckle-type POZ protein-like n=1 Tax=Planococcus citri TaxID=170843 RepID=UPI0031F9A6E4